MVVTTRLLMMIDLMRCPESSATYRMRPFDERATPVGVQKAALVPVPSRLAALPLPASVLVAPEGMAICRMRLFATSVKKSSVPEAATTQF